MGFVRSTAQKSCRSFFIVFLLLLHLRLPGEKKETDTKNPPIFPEIDGILCHALSLSVSVVLASFDFLLYRSVHERKRKKKELEDEEEEDPHIVTPSKREEDSENPIVLPKATFP